MKKNGFLIAQNKSEKAFFTAASAYDRPQWVPVSEATSYPTAEIATAAWKHLLKNNSYSATIVEAASMQIDFPDEGPNKDEPSVTQNISNGEMKAGQLSDDATEDLNQDDDEIEMGDNFDKDDENFEGQPNDDLNIGQFGDDEGTHQFGDDGAEYGQANPDYNEGQLDMVDNGDEENEQSFTSPIEKQMIQGRKSRMPSGQGPIRESVKMPKKPQLDAKPSENKNTVLDLKKPATITFQQSGATDNNYSKDIEPLCCPVKIPKNVMRAIEDSLETYNSAAEFNNGRDDAQASMALTIVDALRTMKDYLNQGTEEGIKQAQIKITSYMNPITTNLPPELFDFLSKHGRQPMSLKTMFYDVWDNKKK
jgi:hypothetical protein